VVHCVGSSHIVDVYRLGVCNANTAGASTRTSTRAVTTAVASASSRVSVIAVAHMRRRACGRMSSAATVVFRLALHSCVQERKKK
jgi:hypothetical protein